MTEGWAAGIVDGLAVLVVRGRDRWVRSGRGDVTRSAGAAGVNTTALKLST